ncbi:MAG: DUF3098 domain-containing protein [Prevotellaceae bacterium]|jgi:hypothetical protein|nr:DUF3098 domain-containing protein [Prevotellaceae bacterium]
MSKKTSYRKRPAPTAPGKPQAAKATDRSQHYKTAGTGAEKTGKPQPSKLFAIAPGNYKYMGAGLVLMVIGFALMIGGGSDDPNVFNEEALFSFTRLTLSTILVVAGFAVEIYAIMKRPSPPKTPKIPADEEE